MNINFKFLLLGTSLSLIPNLTQAQCVATTDCATLGYTEISCPDGKGLKCPFGNTFACPATDKSVCEKYGFKYTCTGEGYIGGVGQACNKQYESCTCSDDYEWKSGKCEKIPEPEKAVFGQCTGYAKNCSIGQILNSDGTCTTNKESGKTPIGVVVYISTKGCGQALGLKDLGNVFWATEYVDIPDLPNYSSASAAEQDFDSCGNTQKIIKFGDSDKYPAAWTAADYVPVTALSTAGKWCLPAAGVGRSMRDNCDEISSGLSKAGGMQLRSGYNSWNWSSSEGANGYAWFWACGYVADLDGYNKRSNSYIRPVIEF